MTQRYDDPNSGLTDRDRQAIESRLAQLDDMGMRMAAAAARRKFGLPSSEPDPLTDPTTWLEQVNAEAAAAQVDELLEVVNTPDRGPADLVAESNKWLAEAEADPWRKPH